MMRARWVVWAALLMIGCDTRSTITRQEPASFKVHIVCAGNSAAECPPIPASTFSCPSVSTVPDLGTPVTPISRDKQFYVAQVSAIGSNGQPYAGYSGTANIYVQFEGSVTPQRATGVDPLAQLPFQNGLGCLALSLPSTFNPTSIWVEDPVVYANDPDHPGRRTVSGTYAAGASEAIYRPAPFITDVETTTDPVLQTSPLNNKHVIIDTGTNGAPIVVTYVTTSYFTVTDLGAPGLDHPWGNMEIYTYSQPFGVQVGSTVSHLNGTVSNYLGLPELNFPVWTVDNFLPDPVNAPIPTPHRLYASDIPQTLQLMAPYKSAVVEVKSDSTGSWVVCALRGSALTSYYKYGEWLISAPTADCSSSNKSFNVVTTATIPNFDPIANAGKKICSLRGMMSVVVPAPHINLWTITPREPGDLGAVIPTSQACP